MHEKCILSVNLPAYKEGRNIYNALCACTIGQKDIVGNPLDPDLFEINILLNRPNEQVPYDMQTENEVRRFQSDHPKYHVHLAKKTFAFADKPIMGMIYKTVADLAIYRNLSRSDSMEKGRLILRTGGADAREKNPIFFANIIENFLQDPHVQVYKSESRQPRMALEKVPLFHVLSTLESGLNRIYTRGRSNIGLGSYSAEVYALAGGFNPDASIAEEIDLSRRIAHRVALNPKDFRTHKNLVKNAIDDPRRALFALFEGIGMARKYDNFGNVELENNLKSFHWEQAIMRDIPVHIQFTPENLSREVSVYYRQYLTRVQGGSQALKQFKLTNPTREELRQKIYEITDGIFETMFLHMGIPRESLSFVQRTRENPAHIVFHDINKLAELINKRTFPGHEVFEKSEN
ncbi:MAG: hypothetical protein PHH70_00290 [Candidatus Gracilibacteria bacterium]|nr:hypothetical protein [Candidatus Gracilibacteria bacterium]